MTGKTKKDEPWEGFTEAILESISDGVFTVNQEWMITSFNRAAEQITGISRDQALGRPCWEVLRSSMCQSQCALGYTLESGKPVIGKVCYIIDSQGGRIPISVSTAMLRNSRGELVGGAETFRDLSEVEKLRLELKGGLSMGNMVSHSPSMQKVLQIIPAVAASTSTVLLLGETGTGKELLARTIHSLGPNKDAPFVAVNCGALPDTLLESELFGYKAGAFTGAERDRPGRFAQAHGGTLLLDEIGEVSQALQIKLLRVLQEKTYDPLGSSKPEKSSARIITATNQDLEELVQQKLFRQDLYYRINIVRIELPPLRHRKEDIPHLSQHFVDRFNRLQRKEVQGLTPEAVSLCMAYDWPGNIRELENIIERAFVLCSRGKIGIEHLPAELTLKDTEIPADFQTAKNILEARSIEKALEQTGNNKTRAASLLGMHKSTLHRKLKKLNIHTP
ncbi:sigma 54-interacting transcriptional regulator [Desulfonatronospira sp.]|uniref:sigma-54 interaction domain-containing protein n=1 Tax=Desulfonatronospira sp. TaxID=1962951 RepID=UPI0025B83E84|nr:sigma 54-interacting transcriptional regulator [Desulfonatronospira sp.]